MDCKCLRGLRINVSTILYGRIVLYSISAGLFYYWCVGFARALC